jgi:hypothetical protein
MAAAAAHIILELAAMQVAQVLAHTYHVQPDTAQTDRINTAVASVATVVVVI